MQTLEARAADLGRSSASSIADILRDFMQTIEARAADTGDVLSKDSIADILRDFMQTIEARAADTSGVHCSQAQRAPPLATSPAIDLVQQFWGAPNQADFDEKEVAPVVGYTVSWLQRARVYGGGPAFVRLGGTFKTNKNGDRRIYGGKILYPKTAVLEFLAKRRLVSSTSEYGVRQ